MKKYLRLIIFSFLYLTIMTTNVYAENCKVISGTGKEIGDEIACDTEHFYIMSNDNENIKIMAKYNLYVGYNIDKIKYDENSNLTFYDYVESLGYYGLLTTHIEESDGIYLLAYKWIDESDKHFGIQYNKAIGAYGGEIGSPEYPQLGVYGKDYVHIENNIEDNIYSEGYYDYEISNFGFNYIKEYMEIYQKYLERYNVKEISLLKISELNDLVYKLTNKNLPLKDWYENYQNKNSNETESSDGISSNEYDTEFLGDLKQYIPDKYNWIWSTTYWTSTFMPTYYTNPLIIYADQNYDINFIRDSSSKENGLNYYQYYIYFIDTLGNICNDNICEIATGAGIRPIVTIPSNQIYYVYTTTDNNGNITYERNEDNTVTFNVTPNNGYILENLYVSDSNGSQVNYVDNKFTMPDSDVTINATFKKEIAYTTVENPKTGTIEDILLVSLILITLIGIPALIKIKKYDKFKFHN